MTDSFGFGSLAWARRLFRPRPGPAETSDTPAAPEAAERDAAPGCGGEEPAERAYKDLGFPLLGRWRLKGTAPDGRAYVGDVVVSPAREGYAVVWRITGGAFAGQSFRGFAVASAGAMAVAFNGGIALYEITGDGRLSGAWAAASNGRLAMEIWARPDEKPS